MKYVPVPVTKRFQTRIKSNDEAFVKGIADAGAKILTTSWLFHTIITQKYSTKNMGTTTTLAEKPKSGSKRKRQKWLNSLPILNKDFRNTKFMTVFSNFIGAHIRWTKETFLHQIAFYNNDFPFLTSM